MKNAATYRKFLVALITAISAAIPLIGGGITVAEMLTLVLVFGGALGVYAVPNAVPSAIIVPGDEPKV